MQVFVRGANDVFITDHQMHYSAFIYLIQMRYDLRLCFGNLFLAAFTRPSGYVTGQYFISRAQGSPKTHTPPFQPRDIGAHIVLETG